MSPAALRQAEACRLAVAAVAAMAVGGCVGGSLASNTGPHPPGHPWSTARRQMVHVGETVEFDFVLHDAFKKLVAPLGVADYCVTLIDGERIEATPDVTGHFGFSYTFAHVKPSDTVTVKTVAYRQRGGRDHMKIRGQWYTSDSPYELPDRKVAKDSVRLEVYEAPIELTIAGSADDLDPDTGVLRIRPSDGSTHSVYIDRPGRPGFTLTGPAPDGVYRVHYLPSGDELSPIGTTEVEFTIHDRAGQPHYASMTLETP